MQLIATRFRIQGQIEYDALGPTGRSYAVVTTEGQEHSYDYLTQFNPACYEYCLRARLNPENFIFVDTDGILTVVPK